MDEKKENGVNGWKILSLVLIVAFAAVTGIFLMTRSSGSDSSGTDNSAKQDPGTVASVSASTENDEDGAGAEASAGASESTAENTGEEDAAQDASTQTVVFDESKTYPVQFTFADGFHNTRLSGVTAYLIKGKSNPTGEIFQTITTGKMGRANVTLPAGEYTLLWGDEYYYDGFENIVIGAADGPGMSFISDSETDYKFWKNLLPRQKGNAICLVLEWSGSDDLDLCLFNATEKNYVSAIRPEDNSGAYLVEDDAEGSPGWEVIVIRDYTKSDVYTPYVRDGNSLLNGSLSAMEAKGVRLSVLGADGLMFSREADPSERAALWMPCYILKGKVITDSIYEYDPAKYAWAAYSKN